MSASSLNSFIIKVYAEFFYALAPRIILSIPPLISISFGADLLMVMVGMVHSISFFGSEASQIWLRKVFAVSAAKRAWQRGGVAIARQRGYGRKGERG